TPLLAYLADLLRNGDQDLCEAVVRVAEATDTPELPGRLAGLINDWAVGVGWVVAGVVKVLASAQSGPLVALADLLHCEQWHIRYAAAKVLGALDGSAATPEIRAILADLMLDSNDSVKLAAVEAVGALGIAAVPEILARFG